ncbi:ABC transporter permease [Dehalococcoides mccartyi]|uniref:ABC-type dipeptide/oligopeptide/nickel transport systems, permease component n=1 Tax=Dehalococcoides mccartyi (strain VS) TaxID=311424 RepID=D2BJ69_DEHMV|nr:ABC transporter permease [Dehalococcoides mccartyi]ACZ62369.1 ABC-type dipeptide/oligopeptide/nickel transport systems, permease component [Dehalococcoides mccartyi VS]
MNIISSLRSNMLLFSGAVLLGIFVLSAVFAPLISPYDPWTYGQAFLHPSAQHLLGTNDVGQDIFSELVYSARVSLWVGFAAASLATLLGVAVGIWAGFRRGWLDNVLMGTADIFLVIPALPLVILLSVYQGPSIWNIILVIALTLWPGTARVIRSQVITIRQSGYVESARIMGASEFRLMWRHVLPNVLPLVAAKFILAVAVALLLEASMSFLGLGDPSQKSWGMMLHYAFSRGGFVQNLYWWYLPPGLCITLCILGLTFINMSFEDRTDPRLQRILDR